MMGGAIGRVCPRSASVSAVASSKRSSELLELPCEERALKIPNMQLALERAGYQLLGFARGYDREMVAPGVVKRVYEAFHAKVLVSDDDLLRPGPKNLSPKAKALIDVLFPA